MPRAPVPLALLLAALALHGCGGHGPLARGNHTGRTAAPPRTLTRASALAFAHAVNLTAADVPGFSTSGGRRGALPQKRAEGELFSCAGAQRSSAGPRTSNLANASSPSFQFRHGIVNLGVSSEVGVSHSASLALAELAALHSPRVRSCFQRYLDSILTSGTRRGTSVGPVTIESGNPPAPGASGSFGWRVRATFGVDRLKVPVYLDLLGFVYGPARVTLISSGALQPFPAIAQQRLFSLLLQRARTRGI
jgi:hypothetical protein